MSGTVTAAEANRLLYSDLAESYDRSEACVIDPRHRRRLLKAPAEALRVVPQAAAVLDACGGSGDVSAALSRNAIVPVVVDVSSEMIEQWVSRAQRTGLSPETHVAPIEEFLRRDDRCWDLIAFSSALHHLERPAEVLALAATRLKDGGAILSIYDPTLATRTLRLLRMVDWVGYLLLHQPREFLVVGRRWPRRRRNGTAAGDGPHIGRLAERHALGGIDDLRLRGTFQAAGLDVIVHERCYEARLLLVRILLRLLHRPSSFRFLAQRPSAAA